MRIGAPDTRELYMAGGNYLLGLDIGGGSARCLLVETETGEIHSASRASKQSGAPGTGGLGFDLDLEAIWSDLASATREALERAGARPNQVLGVAATAMRFGNVVLDAEGEALLAVPNRDARAALEGLTLAAQHGEVIHERTGHWPMPIMAAARLQYLDKQLPGALARGATLLSLSDWVTWRLCGVRAAEPTQSGGTMVFDLQTRDWAWDLVEEFGLPRTVFPEVHEPGTKLGVLRPEAAEALGLRAGTPVSIGGADSQCAMLGSGALAPGDAAAITGTTGPILAVLDRPRLHPEARLWLGHHVVPGRWVIESNTGSLGEALDWFARVLYPELPEPVRALLAEASSAPTGAAGTVSNLGAVVMDAKQPTVPIGTIAFSHMVSADEPTPRRHLARSAVEGLACSVRANFEQLRETAPYALESLCLAGGLTRSETWCRLLAEVLDEPVARADVAETTALGAALCAGVGAGVFGSLEEAAAKRASLTRVAPDPERAAAAQAVYASWSALRAAQRGGEGQLNAHFSPIAISANVVEAKPAAPATRPRMLVTAAFDADSLAALRAHGEVEYASFRERMRLLTGPSLVEALAGAQVFVTEVDIVDAAALKQLPELRVVAACRGDAVNVDVEACSAFGIPVLNAPGRNADAVAELTLAFLMMLARKLVPASQFLHAPDIQPGDMGKMGQAFSTLQGRELWRKTVGLVGFGAVGREVAARLRPFGAQVLVADPYVDPEQAALAGARHVSLEQLLAESDFLSLHAAVTDQTRGLIGADELARMKPGACLVNTARAALVDEEALGLALESGRLAGAALDAFAIEPPGAQHPLLQHANVIATPHVGGNTEEVAAHQGATVAADVARLLAGERPLHVRNPEVLEGFDSSAPRIRPSPEALAALAQKPAPAVSDLQKEKRAPDAGEAATSTAAPAGAPAGAPREIVDAMERVLRAFAEAISADAALAAFEADEGMTLHFAISDLRSGFHFRLGGGSVSAAAGAPEEPPDVTLRMRAETLDGMFRGTLNAMEAAMSGDISFAGDAAKAMTIQHIDGDLRRLYAAAREQAGDPGDLALLSAASRDATPAAGAAPLAPGDVREELVAIVNELYATQLITATGGNVSVRIPGDEEQIWITPSQLFKGDLAPGVLVRLDLDGTSLDEVARSPSSEWGVHCAVFRARPQAKAVIHAHAPNATILVNSGLPFLPISTEAAFFKDLPRIPFVMPGTKDLAEAVAQAMRGSWACLMQNHGIIVAGRSLRRAADMAEIIERTAEIIVGCYAVGREPPVLPDDAVETLSKMGDLIA